MGKILIIWNKIPEAYKGIVLFLICLFGSNYLWELTISGDEESTGIVTFCGVGIGWLFEGPQLWFAEQVHRLLGICGVLTQLVMASVNFPNGNGCNIVPGCTAIKQLFMMIVIILCSRGDLRHKLWYCLVSVAVLICYNILRLTVLTYIVRDHIEWFDVMHEYVMKYIFYGVMFLLWVAWDEWLRKMLDKRRKAD